MKILRYIYGSYAVLVFVLLLLLIFPFVLLASIFGRIRGGNMIYRICMFWGDCWFFLIGIYHKNIYEVPHDPKKQYIFTINHISYLDGPVLVKTLRQPLRALGKIEMEKIPLFGYIYSYAVVKVDRGDAGHRAKSIRNLVSVLSKGISIIIFPEGTFNLTGAPLKNFYDGAFRVAIETQTPIKPVLFLDAYSRMHYRSFFSLNPGRSRSVFLDEVSVEGLTLEDTQQLKEKVFRIMESKLREYKAAWIR
ncbi:MAG: 1-acyl-sn-glycerol-3-phosphate acyltransferase [Terrimonas sp.]|nr:1-acyl-sn-glycerol-3-phosphate acyltransferase [Terrimonas sp.]